jgi:hypothetical protein
MSKLLPMFLAAAAVGLAQALFVLGGLWELVPQYKAPLGAVVGARWLTVSLVGAAWLHAAWSVLERIEGERGRASFLQHSLAVLAVTAATELTGEPLALHVARAVHTALAVPVRPFWAGRPLLAIMMQMWSQGALPVLAVCALATAIRAYVRSLREAGQALRRIQLVVVESQRRAVTERLHSTQAAVDPPFLFSTLRGIADAFVDEPARAQRMLDALIRYLRAALPAASDGGCTLGEQADLVRAWTDVAAAGGTYALEAASDVPQGLRTQPFAPLLLLPLASALAAAGAHRIALRAWSEPGALLVELAAAGGAGMAAGPLPPEFAAVRQRIAVLYGDSGTLDASIHDGRIVACIRLQLPAAGS